MDLLPLLVRAHISHIMLVLNAIEPCAFLVHSLSYQSCCTDLGEVTHLTTLQVHSMNWYILVEREINISNIAN